LPKLNISIAKNNHKLLEPQGNIVIVSETRKFSVDK